VAGRQRDRGVIGRRSAVKFAREVASRDGRRSTNNASSKRVIAVLPELDEEQFRPISALVAEKDLLLQAFSTWSSPDSKPASSWVRSSAWPRLDQNLTHGPLSADFVLVVENERPAFAGLFRVELTGLEPATPGCDFGESLRHQLPCFAVCLNHAVLGAGPFATGCHRCSRLLDQNLTTAPEPASPEALSLRPNWSPKPGVAGSSPAAPVGTPSKLSVF
jgi:hypothetical protein